MPIKKECTVCSSMYTSNDFYADNAITGIMQELEVCYNCAYWIDKIRNRPVGSEVLNGHLYIIHPFVKRPMNLIQGSLGKELYIIKNDYTIIRTNNAWDLGKIPERFIQHFPQTGRLMPLLLYQKFSADPHRCYARGCWNRYHCLRYKMELEMDGPFNQVPKGYILGSDPCPTFINTNELK